MNFNHYGSSDDNTIDNEYGSMDTRTSVGHLSRNIKIIAGEDSGWGFFLMIYGFNSNGNLQVGNVIFSGVEFYEGGQYDTENSAIKIKNLISGSSKIVNSAIHECKSYCLDIKNARNL